MTIIAFTDGASRGNPGEGGIGVILKDEQGNTLASLSGYIGETTNNVAEYTALIACLQAASKTDCTKLVVHSDSELMVRQLTGQYKVKDPTLKHYVRKVHSLLDGAAYAFEIKHIVREQNREADQLANVGINSKKKIKV
jgi:ribonuclease HI